MAGAVGNFSQRTNECSSREIPRFARNDKGCHPERSEGSLGDGENMKPSTVHTGGTWQELVEKWSANMMTLRDQTVAAVPETTDNYRYYIAAGRDHTILMAGKFYTEKSGGSSFAKWVDDFIAGDTMPASTECSSCGSPVQAAGAKLYPHRSKNNNSR